MKNLNLPGWLILFFCLGCCACTTKDKGNKYPDDYNVTWSKQSKNAAVSMPVGGGNLQLNAWCEQNQIFFYIGSTDCYLDNSYTLGKLGRVRLDITPSPFQNSFRQELRLNESEIVFTGDHDFKLTLSTDVFQPVVRVEMTSGNAVDVKASYETWRFNSEFMDGGKILFYHRNASENKLLEKSIQDQKLENIRSLIPDPIRNLTCGGVMYAKGLQQAKADSGVYNKVPYQALHLSTEKPVKEMYLQVAVRMEQDNTLEEWKDQICVLSDKATENKTTEKAKSIAWWKEFWNRSYIRINPNEAGTDSTSTAWQVGRNYQLFRYMLGCTSGGKHPVLFNGGIFNTDSPEFRMWQECEFMAQNQRLVYWPLLKTGDFDIMRPALSMYTDLLPLQLARAKEYWNIEGAAYPESLTIYGLHGVYADPEIMNDCFGRCADRPRTEYGHSGLIHLEYHYTSMLDFAYMALEYARFGGGKLAEVLPFIESTVRFYDNYYQNKLEVRTGKRLTSDNKLELYPSSALELYAGAKNPTDVVAGLQAITKGLLSFNELAETKRVYFNEVQNRLPAIPTVEKEGRTVLPPAQSWELEGDQLNMEFPQLYTLFPFENYTLDDPDLVIAKNTWLYNSKAAPQKNYICWFQGGIYTARLGLTDEAAQYATKKFTHSNTGFPTFWSNPGFCHTPDIDHGGSGMVGLQDMLMQTAGKKIYLLPAWPDAWDCDFKLHAPYNTTVEGRFEKGRITSLNVSPEHRRNDIVSKHLLP